MVNEDYFFLKPGGIIVSCNPKEIHTVLGSCVSVCIYDEKNRVGGMNHFIYHHAMTNSRNGRYGDIAIPYLIKLLNETGGNSKYYTAHIIGGAQSLIPNSIVGNENIKIAKQILSRYNIASGIIDVGGECFRKVIFHNLSGEIIIKKGEI